MWEFPDFFQGKKKFLTTSGFPSFFQRVDTLRIIWSMKKDSNFFCQYRISRARLLISMTQLRIVTQYRTSVYSSLSFFRGGVKMTNGRNETIQRRIADPDDSSSRFPSFTSDTWRRVMSLVRYLPRHSTPTRARMRRTGIDLRTIVNVRFCEKHIHIYAIRFNYVVHFKRTRVNFAIFHRVYDVWDVLKKCKILIFLREVKNNKYRSILLFIDPYLCGILLIERKRKSDET